MKEGSGKSATGARKTAVSRWTQGVMGRVLPLSGDYLRGIAEEVKREISEQDESAGPRQGSTTSPQE